MATPRDFELLSKKPALRSDIFESAVAAVVEQPASGAAVSLGRAVRLMRAIEAAEDVCFGDHLT